MPFRQQQLMDKPKEDDILKVQSLNKNKDKYHIIGMRVLTLNLQ